MTIALGITVFPHNTVKAAGDVEINNTNFPDANFRNWLLSQTYWADGKKILAGYDDNTFRP